MPTIFVTNHSSFFPKFNNFVEAMETLGLTLGLHSEIWEKMEKKSHRNSIEEALELKSIQFISNPRPNRRGGGASISLLPGDFSLSKLDVVIPKNLEVVWGLVRPNKPTKDFKGIIVCSFYSVPYSKRKTQLVQHIAINYTELKTKYKDFFFLTGGDKNDLDIRNILDISSTLHMHNTKPTHGNKNIDVLVSDFVHLFSESEIVPNVPTDIPDGQPGGGKTSDHPIVVCTPRMEIGSKPSRQVAVKKTRRVDSRKMKKLADWIQHESWEKVFDGKDSSEMAEKLIELVEEKMEEICPLEEIKITQLDGKITSLALQKLTRAKKREYNKHGFSKRFHELKKKMKERMKIEGEKALDKVFENSKGKGTKWIREASRLSARPGEDTSKTFTLPSHVKDNLTPEESAEAFVSYFSKISKEYTPIDDDTSSRWMEAQDKLNSQQCSHPTIEEHTIYQNMKSAKITDSVPGDIPAVILKEFLPELATPVAAIIKESVQTHTWPSIYKREYHLPLKKIPSPETEDDVRGIGLTAWASKQLERLVLDWIWPYISPHLDPDQMGGRPGCSIEHYIVKMVHFILSKMDGDRDSAVLAVPVDYSKAYNRMLHSDILCNLVDLNVPSCAIKLVRSYMSSRSMCVRYMGATSTFQSCPGGGPQGGLLTGVLFCLQVNKAGSPCPLPQLPSLGQEWHHTPAIIPISNPEHPSSRQDTTQGPACRPIIPQEENRPLCHKKRKPPQKILYR